MVEAGERPSKIRKLNLQGLTQGHHYSCSSVQEGSSDGNAWQKINNNIIDIHDLGLQNAEENRSSLDVGVTVQGLDPSKSLSKNQLKKLRKKLEWEAGRDSRKQKRKEKGKEKKVRKAERRAMETQECMEQAVPLPEPVPNHLHRPVQVPITFLLDCDFDDFMTDGEITSLSSQLTRCYSDNKSAPYRAHLVISSFGGKLKQRFETVLHNNYLGWKGVKFTELDFVSAATEADTVMRDRQGGLLAGALLGTNIPRTTSYGPEKQGLAFSESTLEISNCASDSYSKVLSSDTSQKATSPPSTSPIHVFSQKNCADIHRGVLVNETNIPPKSALSLETEAEATIPSRDVPSADNSAPSPHTHTIPNPSPPIIYLTSDSPNVLDVLSPYTTYIIGGIVDKNRHKGLCYKRACGRSIPTAKLPIGEYMIIQGRTVLATNHVMEIMLRWLEDGDWGKAFMKVIPKRKEARLKGMPANNGDVEHGREDRGGDTPTEESIKADDGRPFAIQK